MTRLSRRNRTQEELGIKSYDCFLVAMDNRVKLSYRLTDEEFDYLAEVTTREEFALLLKEELTYGEKRAVLRMMGRYLKPVLS